MALLRALLPLSACCLPLVACSAGGGAPGGGSAGGATSQSMSGAPGTAGMAASGQGGGESGGGAGSGGTSTGGAGASGGTSSAGGTSGSGAQPLFFDDFESGSIDAGKWTERINGSGSIVVDGVQTHGGSGALHVTSSGFSVLLAAEGAPIFPAPDNTFYGRVWLYVPTALPENAHVVWIEAGAVDNDQHEVRIGMNLGALQVNLWQGGEIDLRAPDAALMAEAWHCVEFKMGNDELELWLDDVRIDDLSTTDWVASNPANGNTTPRSGWSPAYQALRIGWELNGAEIFYDDVALDHARIGCE